MLGLLIFLHRLTQVLIYYIFCVLCGYSLGRPSLLPQFFVTYSASVFESLCLFNLLDLLVGGCIVVSDQFLIINVVEWKYVRKTV